MKATKTFRPKINKNDTDGKQAMPQGKGGSTANRGGKKPVNSRYGVLLEDTQSSQKSTKKEASTNKDTAVEWRRKEENVGTLNRKGDVEKGAAIKEDQGIGKPIKSTLQPGQKGEKKGNEKGEKKGNDVTRQKEGKKNKELMKGT